MRGKPVALAAALRRRVLRRAARTVEQARTAFEAITEHHGDPDAIPIRRLKRERTTAVEEYWEVHTVNSTPFRSAGASLRYLEARAAATRCSSS